MYWSCQFVKSGSAPPMMRMPSGRDPDARPATDAAAPSGDPSARTAAEAVLQQAIFEDPPELWQVQIRTDPFTLAGYLGRPIGISGYTRYSWSNPRVFRLVGVDWGADLIPTAILWG